MNVSLGVWNGVCGSEGVSEKLKKRVSDVFLRVRERHSACVCACVCASKSVCYRIYELLNQ